MNRSLIPERVQRHRLPALRDHRVLRVLLVLTAFCFIALFIVLPVAVVFVQALSKGLGHFWSAVSSAETRSALWLTLCATAVAVPLNTVFGVAAAWLISRYQFRGKNLLTSIIDLPFSVSPVVSGLLFVLLFGKQGGLGQWLSAHNIRIIFAVPGIILATMFVTLPYVVREVLALMQSQGAKEEEAALTLGASGFQVLWFITLPKIKWALIYGVILCSARALGEFGAVSVVSGHIRGQTNTVPLHIEILYNEYNFAGAFAVASLLTMLAVLSLVLRAYVEHRVIKASGAKS